MKGISFATATRRDLEHCVEIMMDSILGEEYFSRELAVALIAQGISRKEITAARGPEGEMLGFFRLVLDGVFLVFAYVHLFAVKSSHRGIGIGSQLLAEAERQIRKEESYPDIKKSFLLVGKLNRKAKAFYEKHGYTRIATMHDLFSKGDTEFLMMKELALGKIKAAKA